MDTYILKTITGAVEGRWVICRAQELLDRLKQRQTTQLLVLGLGLGSASTSTGGRVAIGEGGIGVRETRYPAHTYAPTLGPCFGVV